MKKRTFLLLVVVMLATVGLGTLVVEHQGYVLISWKNIRFEATLWVFLLCLAMLFIALYVIRLVLSALLTSAGWVNPWSSTNKQKRLQTAIDKGMLDYAQGNWQDALQQLSYAGKMSPQPVPYLLAAARSAQHLKQTETADKLLLQAQAKEPKQSPAIALCQAEIYSARGELSKAQESLQNSYKKYAQHPELLLRLSSLAEQQQDWGQLLKIIPALRKTKRVEQQQLDALEQQAWQGRISQPAKNIDQVTEIWNAMPKALHKNPALLMAFCSQHINFKQVEQAEKLLRHQLNQQFDVQLLQAYAQIPHAQPSLAVQSAERWLEQAPEDPIALYALGKLCLQAELWGKARDYLQASLQKRPQPKVYAELARLLNQMGDHKRSIQLLTASINMQDRRASTNSD